MPNICSYEMIVTGNYDSVCEFIDIMKADYDCVSKDPVHMWRVFSAEASLDAEYNNDVVSFKIYGECAWSVSSCMTLGGYQKNRTVLEAKNGTALEIETKRLNLVAEVYPEERGVGFMEHYIIAFGEIIVEECYDWVDYYLPDFENVKEFNQSTGENWTQEEFESYDDDSYSIGRIEWSYLNGGELYDEYFSLYCIEEDVSIEEVREEDLINILNISKQE